jgi:hypothetical protein
MNRRSIFNNILTRENTLVNTLASILSKNGKVQAVFTSKKRFEPIYESVVIFTPGRIPLLTTR